ncbi:GNAT family N-acetyltransferase [Fictibacillus phosphorivorans]|uniref:GNAT family N-acetyltransferase n=1 Tax=Fictibacillus phosphorivorans TaxID=1221500 RepID=UPI00203D7DCD|nr:GNAT family N-acetyltransferase [Fictibacillus phosphorivorans]MCM3718339.1 GNAT family N-acetyltransferase [Fictibacillus phosphorivorans]MCM3775963.1 GNAT family N-acetyltransferase [Fictibacillus phosphorivorans]
MGDVILTFFEEIHRDALNAFYLEKDQLRFTPLPSEALKLCDEDLSRNPVVIMAKDTPVGFFVLHAGENIRDFTENPNAMVIRALSINHKEQGKGYAKEAMLKIPAFVSTHFPAIDELILAVNFNNEPAQQLYKKIGFHSRGQVKPGPSGPQHVMHLDM